MGTFGEMLGKMHKADREARFQARLDLMKKYQISLKDLEDGKWEIREDGPFGKTRVRAFKLVETVEVLVEGMVRANSTNTVENE